MSFFSADARDYAIDRQIDKLMRGWDLAYFEQLAGDAGVLEPWQARTWVRETVAAAKSLPAAMRRLGADPELAEHLTDRISQISRSLLRED